MKKILCLLVAMVMIVAVVSCAKQNVEEPGDVTTTTKTVTQGTTKGTTQATTQATTTKKVEENPFKEFFEITWLQQLNSDWYEGRWDELELEKLFNVDLQVWAEDGRNAERMAQLVAAGDIPDFFYMPEAPRDPYGMYEEGLARSITLQQMKDWIPGFYEEMEKIPVGFSYNLVPGKTDEYIGFTHNNLEACQYFYDATCVNLDWMEAVGYEVDESKLVPVKMVVEGYEKYNDNIFFTEGNFTFDELNDMLRKFTEDDPDGNGVDDTFGGLYMQETAWTNMTQEGLFGFVHHADYLYKDPVSGDIVPKIAYTPYRDYLAWISDNLIKGYMVKRPGVESWVTEYQQMSGTNKYGIYGVNGGGYLSLNSDGYKVYPPQNILLTVDEDARFLIGPLFRGPEGKSVDMTYSIDPYGTGSYRVQQIGAQVNDAKLKRICEILQHTTFSSKENWYRYKYGIEGIHYKWSGTPYLDAMISTPIAQLEPQYRGYLVVFSLYNWPSTITQQIHNAENNGYWSYMAYMHANGLFEKYALNPTKYAGEAYMGRELWTEFVEDKKETDVQMWDVMNDFKTRALNGQISNFNTEWVQYIDQLYANGLQKMVDKYYNNPAFAEYDPGLKFKFR